MRLSHLAMAASLLSCAACTTADQKADKDYWNKDYTSAYAEFLPLAQGGDWLADERLGYMYAHGLGVTRDMTQAQQWYEKAAVDGDVGIENSLAADALYASPSGPNYPQAAKWYQMAADHHDAGAALELSILYEHGLGVPKDEDTAVHWLDQYVAQTHVAGQKIQYKFSSGGDNTGGFISAVQYVLWSAARRSPDAKKFSYMPVYLSFRMQDGRATDVTVVGSSDNPEADSAAAKLLQDTLLPPVLPSLSHDPNFTVPFALAQGMNGMYVIPSPNYQPVSPAQAKMDAFETDLKSSISNQTVANLRKESINQRGYVLAQFHYQDGKILDANADYLVGDKDLASEVVDQLMRAQLPTPIPEMAGKRVRFLIAFCFLADPNQCQGYNKPALAAVPPDPAGTP